MKALLIIIAIVVGVGALANNSSSDEPSTTATSAEDEGLQGLLSEGIALTQSITAEATEAQADPLSACSEHVPSLRAKADRLVEITAELGELGDSYGLTTQADDLLAAVSEAEDACASMGL